MSPNSWLGSRLSGDPSSKALLHSVRPLRAARERSLAGSRVPQQNSESLESELECVGPHDNGMAVTARLEKLYGVSFVLAGTSVALWTTTHPWGTIVGPEVGGSTRWLISHTFHFTGGLFASLGLLGLHRRLGAASRLEGVGFVVAFLGSVMFTGTGIITAFLWPIFARHAPTLTELSGPIFTPPHPVIGITAILFSVGFLLLWVALARQGSLAKWLAGLASVGALLLVPPPPPLSPVPWVLFPVGGVLFGVGLLGLAPIVKSGPASGS